MLGVEASEIRRYPLRPVGFEEPLFPTRESKRIVAEHLLGAPWLGRASDLPRRAGDAARAPDEPVELRRLRGDVLKLVRREPHGRRRRRSWEGRLVVAVLDRWREVGEWWTEGGGRDRTVFRLLLSGGPIVEVAGERASGAWVLVGIED